MKSFVCLLAIVCACNATFLDHFGSKGGGSSGGSHVTYSLEDPHSHDHGHQMSHASSYSHDHGHGHDQHHGHGYGGSSQVIKVILDAGHGDPYGSSGGHSYVSGRSYGSSGYGHGGAAQIFKVITQNSADPVGASHGWASGSSYGPSYRHGSSLSYNSQLHAILPQILQLILQDDTNHGSGGDIIPAGDIISGGGDDLSSQLISHYGEMGLAVIKRIKGRANSHYSDGHVIQQGVLKIMRVHSTPVHGSPDHGHSSHGPPVHGW